MIVRLPCDGVIAMLVEGSRAPTTGISLSQATNLLDGETIEMLVGRWPSMLRAVRLRLFTVISSSPLRKDSIGASHLQ